MLACKKFFFICWVPILMLTFFFVSSCSSTSSDTYNSEQFYQTHEKGYKKNKKFDYHWVRSGDTLYSIAWQYGYNFKELAKRNKIKPPYVIKKGQKIRVSRYKSKKTNKKTGKKKKSQPKKSKQAKNIKIKKIRASGLKWVWPVKGKVIQKFSLSKSKKGIDIATTKGSPIRATEAGKVVYSGHGLTGYGLLVIIKHNNKYLSTYAHNSKLLVEEGTKVKRNQRIALAGKTAAERVKLHFEIRKNGKPVNPLKYLP